MLDIIDRTTHQLQYGACQLANLPRQWKAKGRDPFRESRSISQIKVTDPNAFLAIKEACSLEDIQDILMTLPSEVVFAGLDGEPVPYYRPVEKPCTAEETKRRIQSLLKQFGSPVRDIRLQLSTNEDEPNHVQISFVAPEVNNEKYQHLIWHIERATGWTTIFAPAPAKKSRKQNPKALLKSMLPQGHRFIEYSYHQEKNLIVAQVSGLQAALLDQIRATFEETTGIDLDIQGQLTFDFL